MQGLLPVPVSRRDLCGTGDSAPSTIKTSKSQVNRTVFKQKCLEKLTLMLARGVLNKAQGTATFLYKHLINHMEVLALPEDTPVPALPPRGNFTVYAMFTAICVPLGPPQTSPKSTGGASFHVWCLIFFKGLVATVGIKTSHCRGGRSGACRATDVQGRRPVDQRLQKLYCLLVSANIYVTPLTNTHLQEMHVLVKDTPAFLRGR